MHKQKKIVEKEGIKLILLEKDKTGDIKYVHEKYYLKLIYIHIYFDTKSMTQDKSFQR